MPSARCADGRLISILTQQEAGMADKQAIAEILGRLAWAYDSGNLDYFEATYAKDGRFTVTIAGMGQVGDYRSIETVMGLYRNAKSSQSDVRRHVITNIFFTEETATSATVVSYLTLIATKDGLTKTLTAGVYTDKFVLIGGAWRLQHRDLALDAPY
jgi:3-phenylpropionate/cinnamic acid dioxygenase small subunit